MNQDKFKHDSSHYERPTQKFRCGRAAVWGKPCEFGPHVSGKCGGTTECRPEKIGDRWQCRRTSIAGGACDLGPSSDGTCSHSTPPCHPRRSLRSLRGIIAIAAFSVVIATIALMLSLGDGGKARDSIIEAGPLTGGHENFTGTEGCASCHTAHDKDAGDWFLSAFHEQEMTEKCLDCHTFEGDARRTHNSMFASEAVTTECSMCHTEHKGENANIQMMSDSQCNHCHEIQIDSFSKNHPKFSDSYPHDRRTSIKFDHVSHLTAHFSDQRYSKRAPADCTGCHAVDTADRAVRPGSFEKNCMQCHNQAIQERELVVMRLPEFEENMIDNDAVLSACGPTLESWEIMSEKLSDIVEAVEAGDDVELPEFEEEEYEAVSLEEASPVNSFLLGVLIDDIESYSEPVQELVLRLAEEGTAPLEELVEERFDNGETGRLLAGLNSELVKRIACAWAANLEYEAPAENTVGGWYGDALELRYAPLHHGDPVAKNWINFALNTKSNVLNDAEDDQLVTEEMQKIILDPKEGVGACTKCHAISNTEDGGWQAEWQYLPSNSRPYTDYSHGAHITMLNPEGINLMDPNNGCRTCHKINEKAAYKDSFEQHDPKIFDSNFFPIDQETCAQCHGEGQVKQDCQLCHNYHLSPGFDLRTVENAKTLD